MQASKESPLPVSGKGAVREDADEGRALLEDGYAADDTR